MKIAIVNEIYTAGATRCARDLAEGLSVRHEVRYYPRGEIRETPEEIFRDLKEFVPDLVHCHSYYGDLPYGFLAEVSHRYQTFFTPHDPRPIGIMDPQCWDCMHAKTCRNCPLVNGFQRSTMIFNYYFLRRLRNRYVHWRASPSLKIITPSRWLRNRLMTTELSRFSICHIPNGIDLRHFQFYPESRRRLRLPQNGTIIFYAAHSPSAWGSNPRKGLKHLVAAFVEVVRKHPDAFLVVAGEGRLPNIPNLLPVGFVAQKDMPLYYSAADIFVSPTLADNLPYTVLEAMACRTPVIASRLGGIPEEVEEGVSGHLVPPADPSALSQAILSLCEDPEKRQRMGKAGRERVERDFSLTNFIERHEAAYRTIGEASAKLNPDIPRVSASSQSTTIRT